MRQLTEYQKKFILDFFFRPLYDRFPGALNIGETLLTQGSCIVPDVGTYIFQNTPSLQQFNTVKKVEDNRFIGCVEYVFDLEGFFNSYYLRRVVTKHYEKLESDYIKQGQMKSELFELLGEEISLTIDNLRINQMVYHKDVYDGHEQMKIVGLRETEVELEGDWSGGTHNVCQRDWMPLEGVLLTKNN
jgi:hypothetical protein